MAVTDCSHPAAGGSGVLFACAMALVAAVAPVAPAALLVFDRVVSEGAPYYTDLAVDAAGRIHLSGFVVDGETARALVSKRSADGTTEIWSLQFGSGAAQMATGIDLDAEGNVYVSGWTGDPAFPVRNALQGGFGGGESDAFVMKIDPTGTTLLFSTFLGGSSVDLAHRVRVDPAGHIHVTGTTESADFPGTLLGAGGQTDAFAVKLSPSGSTVSYSRRIGGSGRDVGNGLALDRAGRAHLIGSTGSADFPVQGPYQAALAGSLDAFIAILGAAGELDFASFLGGTGGEVGTGIAVDAAGNTFVTGITTSTDFPLNRPFQDRLRRDDCPDTQPCGDAFVAKVNPVRATLEFSTFLGGHRDENEHAITSVAGLSFHGVDVDDAGFAWVTGATSSLDFPAIGGLQVDRRRGATDPFLARFQPDGALVFATSLGPGQIRPGEFRRTVASSVVVGPGGNAWVAGASLPPAAGPGSNSGPLGYVARIFDLPVLPTLAPSADGTNGMGDRIRIADLRRLADQSSQLTFDLPAGSGYVVEASTNLTAWTPLFTQPPGTDPNDPGGEIRE